MAISSPLPPSGAADPPFYDPAFDAPPTPAPVSGGISQAAVNSLQRSHPWVIAWSILTLLGGLLSALYSAAQWFAFLRLVGSDASLVIQFMVTVLMAGLSVIPAVFGLRLSGSIKRLQQASTIEAFEDALERHRLFWVAAVVCVVIIGFLAVVVQVLSFF